MIYRKIIFKNINHLEFIINRFMIRVIYRNNIFIDLNNYVFVLTVNNDMIKNISNKILWKESRYPNRLNFKFGVINGAYTIYIHESPIINTLTIKHIHKDYIENIKERYYDKYNK